MPISVLFFALIAVVVSVILIGGAYFALTSIFKLTQFLFSRVRGVPNSTKSALRDARHYAKLIKTTAHQCPPGPMRNRLDRTVKPVDQWLLNLNVLEQSLAKLYAQRNLTRELRKTNFELDQLRRQMLNANEGEVNGLRELMNSKKRHVNVLEELQSFQTQAEMKIRRIASDLGTTHAEMLLVMARGDFNENRFQRLDDNLQDNLSGLRDIMAAMDEINYSKSAGGY